MDITTDVWIDCLEQSMIKNPKRWIEVDYNYYLQNKINALKLKQK